MFPNVTAGKRARQAICLFVLITRTLDATSGRHILLFSNHRRPRRIPPSHACSAQPSAGVEPDVVGRVKLTLSLSTYPTHGTSRRISNDAWHSAGGFTLIVNRHRRRTRNGRYRVKLPSFAGRNEAPRAVTRNKQRIKKAKEKAPWHDAELVGARLLNRRTTQPASTL